MSEKRAFLRYYGCFFLVLSVLLGAVFIAHACDIYFGALDARGSARAEVLQRAQAEQWSAQETDIKVAVAVNAIPIYSRAIVGRHLKQTLPFVGIWLAALVGAIFLAVKSGKPSPARRGDAMLWRKLRALPVPEEAKNACEEDYSFAMAQYRHVRKCLRILVAVLAVVALGCLVPPIVYLCGAHFPGEDLTREVRGAALFALPFLLLLAAAAIAFVYLRRDLEKKAYAALKAANAAAVPAAHAAKKKCRRGLLVARIALLAIGLALVIVGTQNGSMHEVLVKAINICTECIGLG